MSTSLDDLVAVDFVFSVPSPGTDNRLVELRQRVTPEAALEMLLAFLIPVRVRICAMRAASTTRPAGELNR